MNSQFIGEEAWIIHKHSKRCSTSPGITEMQLKSAERCHLRAIRLANIRKDTIQHWEHKLEQADLVLLRFDDIAFSSTSRQTRHQQKEFDSLKA